MTPARLLRILRHRLRAILGRRAQDEALDAELTFHLDQLIQEKIAEGLEPQAARRAALREFGNVTLVTEQSRDARSLRWLHDALQDVGYAWRAFRHAPGFSLVAMTSLGIGIGASTAVLGATRSLLWSPLPFADTQRLVRVGTIPPDDPNRSQGVSLAEYLAWAERSRTLEAIGLSLSSPRELGPEPGGPHGERLSSQAFTPSLFAMLGVQPAIGRLFGDAPSPFSPEARVMVISHRLWQRRYGGSPDILGHVVPTDGGTRTIVGVMPPDFRYHDDDVEFWIPLIPWAGDGGRDANLGRPYGVTARLRPGITLADAQADLSAIVDDLVRALPERFRGRRVQVVPVREAMYGWTKPLLYTLLGAVTVMLAIACTNVAGLLLARGTTRQREIWARLALGASRGRIVRQFLAESLLLGFGSGLMALGVALAGLRLLAATMGPPPGAPRVGELAFDGWLLALLLLLSVATAAAVAALPALAAVRRASPGDASGTAPPVGGDVRHTRARSALVAAELALATVLLVAAGLLTNSFMRLLHRDLNFEPEGLASFKYVVEPRDFSTRVGVDGLLPVFDLTTVPAEGIARVHERLRSVPGIESIGGMTYQPVNSFIIPRFPAWPVEFGTDADGQTPDARLVAGFLVTPDVFRTMRTPLLRGREITDADRGDAPAVVVINRAAERVFFPQRSALGRRLLVDLASDAPAREVVGVVADIPLARKALEPEPTIYLPSRQMPTTFRGGGANFFGQMTFVFRYSGDLGSILAAAREAVAEVDPVRPIVDVDVVRRALDARMPELAGFVSAVSGFGAIALLLAAVGVYGIMAFAVAARARELAIRRALGAGTGDVTIVIARRTLVVIGFGLASGVTMAAGLTGFIESQLVGVAPTDPITFASAAMLLAAVAVVACLAPVRRAIAVNPASVLRRE